MFREARSHFQRNPLCRRLSGSSHCPSLPLPFPRCPRFRFLLYLTMTEIRSHLFLPTRTHLRSDWLRCLKCRCWVVSFREAASIAIAENSFVQIIPPARWCPPQCRRCAIQNTSPVANGFYEFRLPALNSFPFPRDSRRSRPHRRWSRPWYRQYLRPALPNDARDHGCSYDKALSGPNPPQVPRKACNCNSLRRIPPFAHRKTLSLPHQFFYPTNDF